MEYLKVEVLGAVVNGKRKGEQTEIDRRSAEYLAGIGYVKILTEDAPKTETKKAAPKKAAAAKK